ncbi:hypothetical protein [Microlunatus ginsengisoli]|uniref:Uncharacterized protein n=1 Tax=Microlunatus ginsengisoli TaxID=363863 RepID=A0ABP7AH90_9ACTN
MSDDRTGPRLGCLWLGSMIFIFIPAAVIAAVIWPQMTANQFVGRTLLIGVGLIAAALVTAIAIFRRR